MGAIITKLPTYSDGEIDAAFMREIQTGFKMEREKEKDRIQKTAKESKDQRGKTHPVLGKCIASFPARDYFRLTQKYTAEEVHSDAFIKRYGQDPDLAHLCPNKI